MALPSNAFSTFDAKGNREDLSDVIYMITPTDTPFLSGIPRTKATATLHEWQTDVLAAAAANAVIEGDDATTDATTATVRLSNTAQISDKVPRVSGTQEAINKAGRKSEMSYQVAKRAQELKRDMETILLASTAEAAGDVSTARKLGSINAWTTTNISIGAGGSAAGTALAGNTKRTDGTKRAFTEDLLKAALKLCWDNGGDPECIMLGSFNKQTASGFTGNATRFKGAEDKSLQAAIDIYDSDFGELQIIPNRFQRARDVHILQKDMWGVAYLRPFQLWDLAKTGDTERKQLLVEFTLEARNEKASGAVYDTLTE
ncbi:hypothetical protein LCGC14_2319080 [marine sediment metagenome]|uniref:Head protein n=1 Tax=marine sediment metagenome TaxID=412755 RepID=A0A0F9CIF9_9ZZZZ